MKKNFKRVFLLTISIFFVINIFHNWQKIEKAFSEKISISVEFNFEKEKLEEIQKDILEKEKVYKESLKKEIRNPFY